VRRAQMKMGRIRILLFTVVVLFYAHGLDAEENRDTRDDAEEKGDTAKEETEETHDEEEEEISFMDRQESREPAAVNIYADPNCTRHDQWQRVHDVIENQPNGGYETILQIINYFFNQFEVCPLGMLKAMWVVSSGPIYSSTWSSDAEFEFAFHRRYQFERFIKAYHPTFMDDSWWAMDYEKDHQLTGILLNKINALRRDLSARASYSRAELTTIQRDMIETIEWQRELEEMRRDKPSWELTVNETYIGDNPRLPRVYVYDDYDDVHDLMWASPYCSKTQWGHDVFFHEFFRVSSTRVFDPKEADFFFVPAYSMCLHFSGKMTRDDLNEAYLKLVSKLRYFKHRGGEDHIFSVHLPDLFADWRDTIPQSIFLTPETEVGFEESISKHKYHPHKYPPFNSLKDISISPPFDLQHAQVLSDNCLPLEKRNLFVGFSGKSWPDIDEAEIRTRLKEAFSECDRCYIRASESLNDLHAAGVPMGGVMVSSVFCLIPRGRAAWSVRFFEALWAGCVPVILSDYYEVPFAQLFDVSKFTIKWPQARLSELYAYLQSITYAQVQSMMDEAKKVRCWYAYPPSHYIITDEVRKFEKQVCPNLSSTRNVYQAVIEILSRRKRASRGIGKRSFYFPHNGNFSRFNYDMNKLS